MAEQRYEAVMARMSSFAGPSAWLLCRDSSTSPAVWLAWCYKCCHRCNQQRQTAVRLRREPSSSREESRNEDESIYGHGRRCIGSLGRWGYVDRTIGLGWHSVLRFAAPQASS